MMVVPSMMVPTMYRTQTVSAKRVPIRGAGLRERQLAKESSIGALMEHLDGGVLDLLTGAHISLDKA